MRLFILRQSPVKFRGGAYADSTYARAARVYVCIYGIVRMALWAVSFFRVFGRRPVATEQVFPVRDWFKMGGITGHLSLDAKQTLAMKNSKPRLIPQKSNKPTEAHHEVISPALNSTRSG